MPSRFILSVLVFCLFLINPAFAIEYCVEGAGDTQYNGTFSGTEGDTIFQKGSDSVYLRNISNTFWAVSLSNNSAFYGYISSTFAASPVGLTYTTQSTFGPAPTIRLGDCNSPTPTPTLSPTVTPTLSATPVVQLPEKLCLKLYQSNVSGPQLFAKFAGTYSKQSNGDYLPDTGVDSSIQKIGADSWAFRVNKNAIIHTRAGVTGRFNLTKGVDFDAEAGACTAANPPAGTTPPSNVTGRTSCVSQSGDSSCTTNAAVAMGVTAQVKIRGDTAASVVFVPQQIVPVQSDAEGSFSFSGIDPGDYDVQLVGDGLLFSPNKIAITVKEGEVVSIPAPAVSRELYAEVGCKKSNKRDQILSVYDSVLTLKQFLSGEYGASALIAIDRLSEAATQEYLDKLTIIKDAGDSEAGYLLAELFQLPLIVRSGCAKANQCETVKLSSRLKEMLKSAGVLSRTGNKLFSASAKKFKTKADVTRVAKQRKKLAKLVAKLRVKIAKLPSNSQNCPKLN